MNITLIRIAACLVVLVIPFALLAIASGKAEGLIWLMFPVVLAAPALFLLAIVFAPVEAIADARGISKDVAVPLSGGIAGGGIWLAMLGQSAANRRTRAKPAKAGSMVVGTTLVWTALGILLALVWRGSEYLARWFGWLADA